MTEMPSPDIRRGKKEPEWWRSFFSGLAVEMWGFAVSADQTAKEADFILRTLEPPPSGRLLDVPCGNGRLSVELARRGFTMTGVDLSPEFLDSGRTEGARQFLDISWEHRDMRNLPWPAKFDGVFCMGNSFGYLDDAGNAEFLQAVRKVLVPGGRFLLDAGSVAENVLPGMKDHTEMEFGGIRFLEDNRFDKERRRLETSYTFIKDRRTEEKFGSHRIYTLREFATLLSDAGFTGLKSFGSADGEPFEPGKTGLFLIAGKDST